MVYFHSVIRGEAIAYTLGCFRWDSDVTIVQTTIYD